ncbi:hypothetical protein C5B42_02975 [Candidatus Cerribacteria bacterium 'Amazon FNV 2010 28 9']|uniref:Uncharacterized protein n=1 Tax=Candidatus Cerribacteria bacterium 'Amazon FNV 2010 28 9' TaxID=2081795 RepID=A0A317JPZ4_9BACT|nr:MAG: hypothetical protein C5B42_02975 [Candidatus Cerribacteria bacterium 'Amazon FNV 2010 28 9']
MALQEEDMLVNIRMNGTEILEGEQEKALQTLRKAAWFIETTQQHIEKDLYAKVTEGERTLFQTMIEELTTHALELGIDNGRIVEVIQAGMRYAEMEWVLRHV